MSLIEVFKNKSATISYDKDFSRLVQKWTGFAKSNEFREAIDISVEFSQQNKVETILSNTVDQEIINRTDADYAANTMPQLHKNGLKRFAFLVSGKTYAQFGIDHFSEQEPTKLVKYFKDYQEAINWLNEASID